MIIGVYLKLLLAYVYIVIITPIVWTINDKV